MAPKKYLVSAKHTESYDVEISYEEVLAYFQSRRPRGERYPYKARIIKEGIEQNRRGYQPEFSEEMTSFVAKYYDLANREYAALNMQKPKPRPAGNGWVFCTPESLPEGTRLVHQLSAGQVKLFFDGKASEYDLLAERYSKTLPTGATIAVAGKSVSIAVEVPKIAPLEKTFDEQQPKALVALKRLAEVAKLVAT